LAGSAAGLFSAGADLASVLSAGFDSVLVSVLLAAALGLAAPESSLDSEVELL